VQGLHSQNPQEQYEATQWFRKLLSIGEHVLSLLGLGQANCRLQASRLYLQAASGTAVAAAVAFQMQRTNSACMRSITPAAAAGDIVRVCHRAQGQLFMDHQLCSSTR
jgi:hypothetical protein